MKYFFYSLLAMMFFYFLTHEPPKEEEPPKFYEDVKIDSTREAAYFDWDNNRYIYKDELKEDTPTRKIPLTAKPDAYVEITNSYIEIQRPDPEVIIAGKRYRQRKLANGDIQLILVR